MVYYTCLYCKKEVKHKWNYNVHEDHCKEKFDEQINKFKAYDKINLLECFFNCTKIKLNINNILQKKHECNICKKNYKSYNGLKKHLIKNNCKKEIKNKKSITKNITTITNNITNNLNINNNIQMLPYDKIKYDYMELDTVKELFEIPGEALPNMTQLTFFDPKNKENHVIFCPNLKDNQIHVYTKNKFSPDGWEMINKKTFFEQMIQWQIFTLERLKEFNEEEENPLEIKNYIGFNNLVKELDTNKEVKKEYINKLNNLCYQNKEIVKETRDKILALKMSKNNNLLTNM